MVRSTCTLSHDLSASVCASACSGSLKTNRLRQGALPSPILEVLPCRGSDTTRWYIPRRLQYRFLETGCRFRWPAASVARVSLGATIGDVEVCRVSDAGRQGMSHDSECGTSLSAAQSRALFGFDCDCGEAVQATTRTNSKAAKNLRR